MQKNNEIMPIADTYYKKANALINAKGSGTLLSQKIFAVAMQSIREDSNRPGQLCAYISEKELQRVLGVSGNSLYDHIRTLCSHRSSKYKGDYYFTFDDWYVGISDDKNRHYASYTLITGSEFKAGVLRLDFNFRLNDMLVDLHKNYTLLSLKEMISMKSVHSFRLLEILKSAYNLACSRNGVKEGEMTSFTYDLISLKLALGVIPGDDKVIAKELNKPSPDLDAIAAYARENKLDKYEDVHNFMRRAIYKAVDEINAKCRSINIKAVPVKKNRFIVGVQFDVWKPEEETKTKQSESKPTLTDSNAVLFSSIYPSLSKVFSTDDIMQILSWSGDEKAILKAYNALTSSTVPVKNSMGFMKKAIEEGYEKKPHANAKAPAKNKFTDFPQRHYTAEQMEAIKQKMMHRGEA